MRVWVGAKTDRRVAANEDVSLALVRAGDEPRLTTGAWLSYRLGQGYFLNGTADAVCKTAVQADPAGPPRPLRLGGVVLTSFGDVGAFMPLTTARLVCVNTLPGVTRRR